MLTHIDAFLRYFSTVHRRTVRDVAALPPESATWRAPGDMGEGLWTMGEIVGHLVTGRHLFAGAYAGDGWQVVPASDWSDRQAWLPRLEESAAWMEQRLAGTPPAWLSRPVELMDGSGTVSGWRLLLLMTEHEIHHRSQIDTYAGLAGWPVPDLFGYSFEQVQMLAGGPRPESA
jgi:uncharacterized damage-inducible protein DinB